MNKNELFFASKNFKYLNAIFFCLQLNTKTLISFSFYFPSTKSNQIIQVSISSYLISSLTPHLFPDTLKTLKPSSSSLNIHSWFHLGTSEQKSRVTEIGVNRIVNPWSQIINDQLRVTLCTQLLASQRWINGTRESNLNGVEGLRKSLSSHGPVYYTRSCSMRCAHECSAQSTTSPRGQINPSLERFQGEPFTVTGTIRFIGR